MRKVRLCMTVCVVMIFVLHSCCCALAFMLNHFYQEMISIVSCVVYIIFY